jgi:hypothetical protein
MADWNEGLNMSENEFLEEQQTDFHPEVEEVSAQLCESVAEDLSNPQNQKKNVALKQYQFLPVILLDSEGEVEDVQHAEGADEDDEAEGPDKNADDPGADHSEDHDESSHSEIDSEPVALNGDSADGESENPECAGVTEEAEVNEEQPTEGAEETIDEPDATLREMLNSDRESERVAAPRVRALISSEDSNQNIAGERLLAMLKKPEERELAVSIIETTT